MNDLSILRGLIVDDDFQTRQHLRELVAMRRDLAVTHEAATLAQAIEHVSSQDFDLVILDVRLERDNGFHLVKYLPEKTRIIFITGYDQFAIRAFEVNALDYIVKPVTAERLYQSLDRLSKNLANDPPTPRKLLRKGDRVFLRGDNGRRFVPIADIRCLVSEENYTSFHLGPKDAVLERGSLVSWEQLLPSDDFFRVNRSTIVNKHHIEKIEKDLARPYKITINGIQEPFVSSRRNHGTLKQLVKWFQKHPIDSDFR